MQLLTSPTISVAYAFEELLYLIHFFECIGLTLSIVSACHSFNTG